ncbi:MAG: phage tail tube assembly chaperone [Apilactobacillus waqarii]|uniref:phage tail tube assembly chaperone n=1 Tax=Apilactobacillus waqarii TaxID=2851006 RepID=UPI003F33FD35
MSVKINVAEELGIKKSFEVKESNKNMRKTWQLQKLMAKLSIDQELADDDSPEKVEKMIDLMLDVQSELIDYVASLLKLTDVQAEKLDDLEFNETRDLAVKISAALMHIDPSKANEEETGLEA